MQSVLCVFCLITVEIYGQRCITSKTQGPRVTVPDGEILGTTERTIEENKICHTFRGIPFAQPPIENLRFQPPVKNKKWNCTLDATKEQNMCIQLTVPIQGQEDCLYLNVYTPNLSPSIPLSVMVWLYGGTFVTGSSTYKAVGPDYLLEQGIIFVSVNYRLGIFGFLSTEDMVAPGNVGLKDQVLALEWVQQNIRYFGGDPKKVTAAGQSAGSTSVSYLLLSPLTKGLFRSAIMESGSSLCLWGLSRNSAKFAFEVGKKLNINATSTEFLVQSLKRVEYTKLQAATTAVAYVFYKANALIAMPLAPVLEPEHKGAFLTKKMDELFTKGAFHRVPMIIGFNSNESSSGSFSALIGDTKNVEAYLNHKTLLTPADLTNNEKKKCLVGNLIEKKFFNQSLSGFQFANVDQFLRPLREQVIQTSKRVPTYFYRFSYVGVLPGNISSSKRGVGHGEDLSYLFRRNTDYPLPEADKLTRSRLVKMWTNFVKYRNPTPSRDPLLQEIIWPQTPSQRHNLVYLDINKDLKLYSNPDESYMDFFDDIYKRFGDPPYDTY